MNNQTTNIDEIFTRIAHGDHLSSQQLHSIQISEQSWRNCAIKAFEQNNTTVLQFLQNNDTIGYFWHWLSEMNMPENEFLQILPWCQAQDLNIHQNLCVEHIGVTLIEQNSVDVFFKFFNHVKPTPNTIRTWTKKAVFMRQCEIAEILIPQSQSADCLYLLSESILSDLPSLDPLLQHMDAHDIGQSCGMIAHAQEYQQRIVDILNANPESWEGFILYDNDVAGDWMKHVYAEHQKIVLQQHVSHSNISSRKSKL